MGTEEFGENNVKRRYPLVTSHLYTQKLFIFLSYIYRNLTDVTTEVLVITYFVHVLRIQKVTISTCGFFLGAEL